MVAVVAFPYDLKLPHFDEVLNFHRTSYLVIVEPFAFAPLHTNLLLFALSEVLTIFVTLDGAFAVDGEVVVEH